MIKTLKFSLISLAVLALAGGFLFFVRKANGRPTGPNPNGFKAKKADSKTEPEEVMGSVDKIKDVESKLMAAEEELKGLKKQEEIAQAEKRFEEAKSNLERLKGAGN